MNNAVCAAIGAAAGIGTDVLAEQRSPWHRALVLAGGVITAAAVFPAGRLVTA